MVKTGILANQKAGTLGQRGTREKSLTLHDSQMTKYRTIVRQSGRAVSNKLSDPRANYESDTIADVNLSIKVPRQLRQHWAAEAKRHGTTLTAVIKDALTKRFGGP
jgi:hypothetical protein